ncbi:MAG: Patatin [Lachnospiraceae bacterium]|nr:Patatin [Lachnospiraceae bacterium]
MNHEFDFEKEYGLVLEGGGAKGAYQIGVWKALLEIGVKIKGVAGVSVGALNGALICMGDYAGAKELWSDIKYSTVMKVNDEIMEKLRSRNFKEIDLKELTKDTIKILTDGGIDISPLKQLINEWVDEDRIQNSEIEFILGAFLLPKLKEVEISARDVDKSYLKDYLLASSYLPAFRNEKLHGTRYLDGGMFNNVPVNMLINRGYKDIIVVRIYGMGLEKPVKIPEDVTIIEIAPRVNLGGMLEFDSVKINRNMKIGYHDALRSLHSLKGKIYYLQSDHREEFFIGKLFSANESVKKTLLEYYHLDATNVKMLNRIFISQVCPRVAIALKLEKEWNYEDLYLGLMEFCAKSLKIQKYRVYGFEDLNRLIQEKYRTASNKQEEFPTFLQLVLNLLI